MLLYQQLNVGTFHKEKKHFKQKKLRKSHLCERNALIRFRMMMKTKME